LVLVNLESGKDKRVLGGLKKGIFNYKTDISLLLLPFTFNREGKTSTFVEE